ncbi:lipoyl domain-containing protein, partial [Lichenihabitans sp. Uapishka_5]|uniref:lipoyl domain-containing protein n=1 Tax=Lichenihabitans sp. Uapishka_5 TaxID=3037302 RepID=UPI0029E805E9
MPSEVILPRVDMDMATGKISKWLVEPGATVAKGQPLFEIETDKATMEIEAEASGTIRDLAAPGSTNIPVGSTVAWIFADNEAAAAPASHAEPAPVAALRATADAVLPDPVVAAPAASAPA